ncbi:MAG TPA: peptide chain release factor N(5)-glutamine methyltransferase [Parvularcula sp.]|nr:peptide chain release factor N(5)-glutamine methyltransferase [Parvularcula sp.]HBS33407.1 peptide chain release factor N(5)-glutamine methyltransferase [Parvularcula sp.]HBS35313.1 peptide chain release factor N(5)-glutamine methyltransferase [Parvularcula sp.]
MRGRNETIDAMIRRVAAGLKNSTTPLLDARLIVGAALHMEPADLIAAGAKVPDAEQVSRVDVMASRRARGEPVAYITGEKEFWGLSLDMTPGVLVPRPDTETLVATALARRPHGVASILDLGCGSGALLCALLAEYRRACGLGVDLNHAAVALTRRNLARNGLQARGRAEQGDWNAPGFESGLGAPFDLVVSNPPYIPETERGKLPPEVEVFEDHRALFSGADGLNAYRRLADLLPAVLAPDGLLLLEIGFDQATAAGSILGAAFPESRPFIARDLADRDRALIIDLRKEAR